jgi:histidinol-phosphate aminotransferase
MRVRISHLVNSLTRQALFERVPGYVAKETDFEAIEAEARDRYGIEHLHRFDLGENADGCSPRVTEFLRSLSDEDLVHFLSGYPESAARLKRHLSELHSVPQEWIALGTGVVSFISILCHAFYEWGDRVVIPTPSFFVIEEYALRSGALPIYIPLSYEDGFTWTPAVSARIVKQIQCVPVKMLWLCSPNNPTGQPIPHDEIEAIVRAAEESFTMVVVDEAYGEYTDDRYHFRSSRDLLAGHENLIVLRSFSKAYGLAGMRVGYAMMSSQVVHDAVARQMEYFPITKLSAELAGIAAGDQEYIAQTRRSTAERMTELQSEIRKIGGFECVPSFTNTFLCRQPGLPAFGLQEALLKEGVLVATADVEGLKDQGWVRITCRRETENENLLAGLRAL